MEFLNTLIEVAGISFTTAVRWIFMLLALFILLRQIHSLLRSRNPSEIWAYLSCPDGSNVPLTHWENLIGRGRGCDVIVNLSSVSRSHATLIRDSAGTWTYNDLSSKNGSFINGNPVEDPTVLKGGDVITIGGSDFSLYPVSLQERMENIEKRKRKTRPVSPWPSLLALTAFNILAVVQFSISLGEDFSPAIPTAFFMLCILMWAYVIIMRMFKRTGFEMEIISFFLSTLSLAVVATKYPDAVLKQAICICLGVALFFGLCWYLRDLNRAKKLTYILMGISAFLLIINLLFGTVQNGARNWIEIASFSLQPSELVKIVFIYVGAATLDELQQKKNLTIFMAFSVFCLGCLAIMGDFGTAIIFFVTFLVISFLRSGDFSKLILIIGAAGLMGMMILRFKPYIADRFDIWGHVWEDPLDKGFQQVQTMCAASSGGLVGIGAGEGKFGNFVFGSETDLVFGLLSEEWGLIIAILSILCIITLGIFAVRAIIAGRSTYYSIAACAAASMFIFQTILNVFGSVDLLPITGVTFPFVSAGGTSMITSWGLLAFLKAADTRQNASFAIRLDKKNEFENDFADEDYEGHDEILREINEAPNRMLSRAHTPGLQHQVPVNDFTYHSNRETRIRDGSSESGGRIKYKDFSDDDFFRSFEDAPATDIPEKKHNSYSEISSSGLSKADEEFFSKMMDGPKEKVPGRQSGNLRHSSGTDNERNRNGKAGRNSSNRNNGSRRYEDKDNEPLTLNDIFGGDKK